MQCVAFILGCIFCTGLTVFQPYLQVNYMAVDMLRAQATEKANPAPSNAPGLGMVSATAGKAQVPAAMLTGIDALERSAEQEAWQRSNGAGEKRKLVASDDEGEDGPARKAVRDADEIDI